MKYTHHITREQKNSVKEAIRTKYAWPGGYPLFIITADSACLCIDCAKKEFRQIAWDWTRRQSTGWCAVATEVNWEDNSLYCDNCSERIESAYGEDEEEQES